MLVLLDKTVQRVRVSPAKATSDGAGLGLHPVRVHANRYTGEHLKKMHGALAGPSETFHAVPRRSVRAGGIAMKTSLTVLVLVLLLSILDGCAPGPHPS